MSDKIQLRGDTQANTTSTPPTLEDRELYIEKRTNGEVWIKCGNGMGSYDALPYLNLPGNVLDGGVI